MINDLLMLKALFCLTDKDRIDISNQEAKAAWERSSVSFTEGSGMDHRHALSAKLEEVIKQENLTIGD